MRNQRYSGPYHVIDSTTNKSIESHATEVERRADDRA